MATVRDLARSIEDPDEDDDGSEAYDIATELVAGGDQSALPALNALLVRYLNEGNFFGRDMVAVALAGIAGVESLPALLEAAARDLGDDQDGLSAEIWGALADSPVRARQIIGDLQASPDPRVRARAFEAAQLLAVTVKPSADG